MENVIRTVLIRVNQPADETIYLRIAQRGQALSMWSSQRLLVLFEALTMAPDVSSSRSYHLWILHPFHHFFRLYTSFSTLLSIFYSLSPVKEQISRVSKDLRLFNHVSNA